MTQYNFQELVDVERLQQLMDRFYAAACIPVGIIDVDGKILVATGWQEICTDFHRVHPQTHERCRQSDDFIMKNLPVEGHIEYKCRNGLWDLALPLVIAGEHLATLFLGQFFYSDEAPDHEFFRRQALEFGFDEEKYLAAMGRVPTYTREKIQNVMEYYSSFVRFLMETGLTNLKQIETEKALRKSKDQVQSLSQEFQALFNGIPDSLSLISPDLTILWGNNTTALALGIEPSEIIGRHCYKLWHALAVPCQKCPVQLCFTSEKAEKLNVCTPDNKTWEVRAIPVKGENGKVVKVIEIARDITQKINLEQQLQHSQKMEAVGQLAGGVAHDFNNILTAIIGFASLMHMKAENNVHLRRFAEQIISASEKGAGLTQSLLAFSRKQIMEPHPLDLNQAIRNIQKLLRRLLMADIEFETKLCPESIIVMADSIQFEQVLMNLVSNARDAMPNGGALFIGTEPLAMDHEFADAHGYGVPGKYACISISDTGIGMDRQTREKIFDPFFTTKAMGKGTGLGLAMAYGIVKQHDGYINVYSEPGHGTTFKIYLPLINPAVQEAENTTSPYPAGGMETVLLAEDSDYVREANRELLENFGYNVIEAVDGEDAIDKVVGYGGRIDIMILDVIMPKKSGKEVYDTVRKIREDIKVLFTSGYTADIITQQGLICEKLHFIAKPIVPRELLKKVREVLSTDS